MNMLFLYWFGKLIDEYLGTRRLINLYLLGGIIGGISYLLIYNLIPNFRQSIGTPLLGASGAVYAVVIGAATLMPNYTFFLLLLGAVRIKYIAAFFLVLSFVDLSRDSNPGGNIAHLGGALLGFIFITQLKKGNDLGKPSQVLPNGSKTVPAQTQAKGHPPQSRRSSACSSFRSQRHSESGRNRRDSGQDFPFRLRKPHA